MLTRLRFFQISIANFNQLILFVSSLNMVALCIARHQTPTYDNLTAFIILDWDWHRKHSAPAQCPACTQANEASLEERRIKLSMHYYLKTRACIDSPAHQCLALIRPNQSRFKCSKAKWERPWSLHGSMPNWSALWGHPTFHQERTITIPSDTNSLKE